MALINNFVGQQTGPKTVSFTWQTSSDLPFDENDYLALYEGDPYAPAKSVALDCEATATVFEAVNTGTQSFTLAYMHYNEESATWSTLATASTTVNIKAQLAKPTGLAVSQNSTTGAITLSWNAVTNATSYEVFRDGTSVGSTGDSAKVITLPAPNTTYTFSVVAKANNYLQSDPATKSAGPQLAVPSGISATQTVSSVTLSWGAVSHATGYQVYNGSTLLGSTSNRTYTVNSTTPGTTYQFYVRATASGYLTSDKGQLTVKVDPKLPTPTGLSATPAENSVKLKWNAVTNATSYQVYNGSTYVGSASSTTFTHNGTVPGTTYNYKLVAVASGYYDSTAASITVTVNPKLATPTGLSAAQTVTTVTLTWNAVSNAESYHVYQGDTLLGNTTGRTYPITTSPGTNYTFSVVAVATGYYNSNKASISVTTQAKLPKPTGLEAAQALDNVTFKWRAVTNAKTYTVYRGTTSLGTVSGTSMSVSLPSANTVYTFGVVANATGYYSSDKATIDVGPRLAPPSTLTATQTISSVTLSWSAVTGANAYDVYNEDTLLKSVTSTTYTVNNTTPGTTYTFKVRARGSGYWASTRKSATVNVNPQLATPKNLAATQTQSAVSLTWTAVSHTTSYSIYNGTTLLGTSSSASYTHSSVTPGTTYNYRVIAKASGYYDSEAASLTYTVNPKLSTPTGLAYTQTESTVTVTWNAVSNATGYATYKGNTYVASTSNKYYKFPTNPGTSYTFKVGATANNYYPSDLASISLTTAQKLAAPSTLTASQTETTVSLSWSSVTNATTYDVYNGDTKIVATSSTSYTVTGTTPGTTYTFKVRAKATGYWDSTFKTVSVSVKPKLAIPAITGTTQTVSSATFAWNASPNATTYIVYRNNVQIDTTTSLSYTISASPGSTYTLSVKATASGYYDSDVSTTTVSIKPKLSAPTGLSASQTVSSVTFSWSAVAHATAYTLTVGTTTVSVNTTSYTAPAQPGNTYVISVYATATGYYNSDASTLSTTIYPQVQVPSLIESAQDESGVTLTWTPGGAMAISSYTLSRNGAVVYTGSSTTYTDTSLARGSIVTYTLVAYPQQAQAYPSNPARLEVRFGVLTPSQKYADYLKMLRKPYYKLCRLRFLNPNGTTAFALDNNPGNRRSKTFISDGSVSANLQNGQRMTASVTLSNVNQEYETAYNKIWFGQQVALDEGLILSNGEEYYRQTGVFYIENPTESVNPEQKTVTYNLVDKWAVLDGSLDGNLEMTYECPLNSNIFAPITALLVEDSGNGQVVDYVNPVYTEYYNSMTQELPDGSVVPMNITAYTLRIEGDGGTIAAVLLGLAGMVNAWIGYDNVGALRVDPSQDDILDTAKPVLWRFRQDEAQQLGLSYQVKKTDVYNDYIVVGEQLDDNSQPGGRAQNLDPRSDTCIQVIGRKTKRESASGFATTTQCMDLAEWRLKRSSILQRAVTISCAQMMHIDLNALVEVVRSDKPGAPLERHLVQGYTRPLTYSGAMSISAVSTADYPNATVTPWPEP